MVLAKDPEIPRTEPVNKVKALEKMESKRTLTHNIRKKWLKFLWSIMSKEGLENVLPEEIFKSRGKEENSV